jgi:hypothetical protein
MSSSGQQTGLAGQQRYLAPQQFSPRQTVFFMSTIGAHKTSILCVNILNKYIK